MRIKTRVYFILIVIYLMAQPVIAASNPYMPKAFQSIYLGMSEKELKVARPKVRVLQLFKEPEEEDEMSLKLYFEDSTESEFFGKEITYGFFKGKLCLVNFQDIDTIERFKTRRTRIFQGAIKKWGVDYSLMLDSGEPSPVGEPDKRKEPILLWKIGEIGIKLTFNPSPRYPALPHKSESDKYSLILAIFNRNYLPPTVARTLNRLVPATEKEKKELFEELKATAISPLFE